LTYFTPPFPEYVSGHSTFSAAAAVVLTEFTGSDRLYDGVTMINADFNQDGIPDMLASTSPPWAATSLRGGRRPSSFSSGRPSGMQQMRREYRGFVAESTSRTQTFKVGS
jgi:hypothetical protein